MSLGFERPTSGGSTVKPNVELTCARAQEAPKP